MAKQKKSKSQPKPTQKTTEKAVPKKKDNTGTYVFIALVLTGVAGYMAYKSWHIQQPIRQGTDLTNGQEHQVVARTQPELGEELPKSIVKLVDTPSPTVATSITVYEAAVTPPQNIIDVTAQLAIPEHELQAAEVAQATLKMAQQVQAAKPPHHHPETPIILALYSAMNTGAPEAVMLAKQLNHPVAETLLASLQIYGPLILSDVLAHADIPPMANIKLTAASEPTPLPGWWERTLGKFIHVTKTTQAPQNTEVAQSQPGVKSTSALPRLLKQGNWPAARQAAATLPEGPYQTLAQAYILQRESMATLLQHLMESPE